MITDTGAEGLESNSEWIPDPQPNPRLPGRFCLGVATSSHQVEAEIQTPMGRWEQRAGSNQEPRWLCV